MAELIWQRYLRSYPKSSSRRLLALPYDLVVVDTPPALGLRHLGPQVWADVVVTALEPNSFSLLALSQILAAIEEIRALRPSLQNRILTNRFNRTFSIAVSKKDAEGNEITRWIRCDDWKRLSRAVGKGDRVKSRSRATSASAATRRTARPRRSATSSSRTSGSSGRRCTASRGSRGNSPAGASPAG